MPPAFPITLALYAVSCALHLAYSATGGAGSERLAQVGRLFLAGAFCSHAVDIGVLCVRGNHPFVNAREALSFVAWLTVGAYLISSLRFRLPTVGALVVPVTIVLDVAARLGPTHEPQHASTLLATVHIGLATAGVAVFAVAAVDAVIYLVAERRLKARRFDGALFKKGPPLELLDRLNRGCILLGFPMFTVAMVTGALWVMRLPDGGAHRLLQPQYALSTVAWALYAGLLVARVSAGWRGRRAALVTLAGFGAALCVLAIYYLRGAMA